MSCKTECITCGCSAEKDKYGDRICYCATCKYRGGCIIVQWNKPKPIITECITCGCSAEKDEYGDRICYCATCKERGGCIIVQWNKSIPKLSSTTNITRASQFVHAEVYFVVTATMTVQTNSFPNRFSKPKAYSVTVENMVAGSGGRGFRSRKTSGCR